MNELLRNNHFNQIRRLFSIQPYTTFDHNSGYSRYLAYKKRERKFRICVYDQWDHDPLADNIEDKPWSEWPRDVRLESVEKLPDLLLEIASQTSEKVAKYNASIGNVSVSIRSVIGEGS